MVEKVTRVFWKEKHLVFMGILLVENGHLWIPVCNAPSTNIATNCGVNFMFYGYKFQCFILGWNLFSKILDFCFCFCFFFPFLGL